MKRAPVLASLIPRPDRRHPPAALSLARSGRDFLSARTELARGHHGRTGWLARGWASGAPHGFVRPLPQVAGTSRVRQTPSQTGGALVDALWPQRSEGLATEVGSSAPPPASVAPTSGPVLSSPGPGPDVTPKGRLA